MPPEPHKTLGMQELALLRYVTDHAPITVRAVAQEFGEPQGLARTTILTVMERLRRKGYLNRTKNGGSFIYSPEIGKPQLLKSLVGDFVRKSLGGSLSPFVAYLTESSELTDDELAELRSLVEKQENDREAS